MLRILPVLLLVPIAACSVDLGDFADFDLPDSGTSSSSGGETSSSSSGGISSSSSGSGGASSSSSGSGTLADAGDAGLDPATVAAVGAQAIVDKAARCLGGTFGTSRESIEAMNLAHLLEPGITKEQMAADVACAQSLANSCLGTTPECLASGRIPGSLADGTSCLDDDQCSSGVCDRNSIACGTCIAALGAQQPCDGPADSRCGLGLSCVGAEGSAVCTETTLLAENDACAYFADTCGPNLACTHTENGDHCLRAIAPEAACSLGSVSCDQGGTYQCSGGSCEARPDLGGHCDSTPECKSGLVCDSSACRAPKSDLAIGATCTPADHCVDGASCSRYEQSTFLQYCAADAAQGQPCGNTVGGCQAGLICGEGTHTCEPTPPAQTCP